MRPWCSSAVCCMMILDENPFTLSMKTLDLRQLHLFQIFKSIWSSLALNLISVWDHSFLSFICLHSVIMWTSRSAKITTFKKKSPNLMFRCGGIIYTSPLDSSVSGGGSPSEIMFPRFMNYFERMTESDETTSRSQLLEHTFPFPFVQILSACRPICSPSPATGALRFPGLINDRNKVSGGCQGEVCVYTKKYLSFKCCHISRKKRKGLFYSVGFIVIFSVGDKGF